MSAAWSLEDVHRTGGAGGGALGGRAGLDADLRGLDCKGEGARHLDGIVRRGDGGIGEDGIRSELDGLGCVGVRCPHPRQLERGSARR